MLALRDERIDFFDADSASRSCPNAGRRWHLMMLSSSAWLRFRTARFSSQYADGVELPGLDRCRSEAPTALLRLYLAKAELVLGLLIGVEHSRLSLAVFVEPSDAPTVAQFRGVCRLRHGVLRLRAPPCANSLRFARQRKKIDFSLFGHGSGHNKKRALTFDRPSARSRSDRFSCAGAIQPMYHAFFTAIRVQLAA